MKIRITLLAVLLLLAPAMAQDAQPASDSLPDARDDVIQRQSSNETDEDGNPAMPPLVPGSGHAPEIDITNVRAVRLGNNLTITMETAGTPIPSLKEGDFVTQVAYMLFVEDLAEGQQPSSKTGKVGNWAEVIRCAIQIQGNLTCAAAKAQMRIASVDIGQNAVVVETEIFDETMFQRLGVGGFTLMFRGTTENQTFLMDMTSNLDVQNAPASTDAGGPSGLLGMLSDLFGWLFGFPQVLGVAILAAYGVSVYVKRRQEAESSATAPATATSPSARVSETIDDELKS